MEYIPALRFHSFTKLYDPCIRLVFGRAFERIARTIPLSPHMKILDVGCGPGNLLIALSKKEATLEFTGLDIDPEILSIARKKKNMPSAVQFFEASAAEMPFSNEAFDTVVSSLAFHHLPTEEKERALREIYRVLKPNGTLWLFDFLPSRNWLARLSSFFYRYLEEIDDNISGRLEEIIHAAGFRNQNRVWNTYGIVGLLSAVK